MTEHNKEPPVSTEPIPTGAANELQSLGNTPIGAEEAQSAANAQQNLSYVDQNWGMAGKFGAGLGSGLTLGLGPGMAVRAGLMDPGHLQAAQASPLYTLGDITGAVAPAVMSGGESLAGRGLQMTPAGLMNRAGSLSERLATGVLGEAPGLMGSMASAPLRMAARGATEGALINMGHTIGDSLVTNSPLGAEAIAASGMDGALFGGLIGGTLGSVGAIGSKAVESMGDMTKSVIGKNSRALGLVGRSLGYDADEVALAEKQPGGTKGLFKAAGDILDEGGSSVGDSAAGKLKGVRNAIQKTEAVRNDVVQTLSTQAPTSVPSIERIQARLNAEVVLPRVGTVNEAKAAEFVDSAMKDLRKVKPDWDGFIQSRDQLAAGVDSAKPMNRLLADTNTLKAEVLNAVDSEIRTSMESSGVEGASERYGAATQRIKLAQGLEANLGKKAANALMSTEPNITNRDLMWGATGAALGHPVSAVSYLAGKGIGRQISARMEPWVAQMAYNQSIGAKASQATMDVKSKIGSTIRNFFKNTVKSPTKAVQTKHAEDAGRTNGTREQYEAAASRVEQLLSNNHQDKVRRYTESLQSAGYPELAGALMGVNQRAVQYAAWNMPPRQATKALSSLRPQPMSKVQTLPEMKFIRQVEGIGLGKKGPLSLLDDLESGKISKDSVQAMKYVYPELHNELVSEATTQIYEMKVAGEYLPMDKISSLGVLLDAPIDRVLEADYVGAVQASLNAPPAQDSQGGSGQQPQDVSMTQGMQNTGLLTPLQTLQVG